MQLGVQTLPFEEPLEETLAFLEGLGVESVDWRPDDPDEYLDAPDARAELLATFEEYGIELSMVGATGPNPLHPIDERAEAADALLRKTIRLADQLDVGLASAFSGLPGGTPEDRSPNWIVAPIPPADQHEHYDYQWEVAIPYWREVNEFADDHGVDVGIEIHTNMLVNSPATMMRLREAAGDRIGAYVDPGHFWLQNIDPIESIRYLAAEDAIVHVEASDVVEYESNRQIKGMWDMTPLDDPEERPWAFCAVGYGHGEDEWRDIVGTLDLVGYDGPVSIQQLNTPQPLHAGVEKGAELLGRVIY